MTDFLNTLKFVGLAVLFFVLLMVEVFLLIDFPKYRLVFCIVGAVLLALNYSAIASKIKNGFRTLRDKTIELF